jgi:hypothetical protein
MSETLDPPDAVLLDRLRPLVDAEDPVPPEVLAAARASSTWRRVDEELAELTADSLDLAAGVRGGAARLLTFEAGGLTIEVEVSADGAGLRVLGQVVPPQVARVRIEQPGGATDATADALGRFRATGVMSGSARFVCVPTGGVPVRTGWTVL